jgi:hypothetical protein
MSNYLLELEIEIILKWPATYSKLRKSHSDGIITSFGICIRSNPCWYIFAQYDRTIITIDLYVVEDRADFNQVIWSLTSAASATLKGVNHILKYWVKPDEVQSGYETIHFKPDESLDKEGISIMTVKQVVGHIDVTFNNNK